MASSVIDLDALYPNWNANGLTWIAFGNFTQTDIDGLKIQWFPKDAERRGRLQDIWTRHHDRQQGIKSFVVMMLINHFHVLLDDFML